MQRRAPSVVPEISSLVEILQDYVTATPSLLPSATTVDGLSFKQGQWGVPSVPKEKGKRNRKYSPIEDVPVDREYRVHMTTHAHRPDQLASLDRAVAREIFLQFGGAQVYVVHEDWRFDFIDGSDEV